MSEKIIGIDLGTATTEAALFTDGQVHMIPNPDQQNITPSAVGLDETGKITVGEQAKAAEYLKISVEILRARLYRARRFIKRYYEEEYRKL